MMAGKLNKTQLWVAVIAAIAVIIAALIGQFGNSKKKLSKDVSPNNNIINSQTGDSSKQENNNLIGNGNTIIK